jgi:hypothetical protein
MQQHAADRHLHPRISADLQTAAELDHLKQHEPSSSALNALEGGSQPALGRRRQHAPAKGGHQDEPASADSQLIASLKALGIDSSPCNPYQSGSVRISLHQSGPASMSSRPVDVSSGLAPVSSGPAPIVRISPDESGRSFSQASVPASLSFLHDKSE